MSGPSSISRLKVTVVSDRPSKHEIEQQEKDFLSWPLATKFSASHDHLKGEIKRGRKNIQKQNFFSLAKKRDLVSQEGHYQPKRF
jgi:hypothetical protein